MEDYLQTEWPELEIFLTSVSEHWAVIAVQGPRARDVIAPLVADIDLSPGALPHMAVRTGHIGEVPCRLFRVSFTGELGFEINVPADYARTIWEAVYERGQAFGITPYGTQTMHVLRAEKGYIIVGQETDGTVSPDDLGLAGMIAAAKPDFVGKRSLARPDLRAAGRQQLVGLLTEDTVTVLDEGAQIVADPREPLPMRMLGHVTSSYASATLGRPIALALLADGRALHGRTLHVTMPAGFARALVCEPVFFDRQGERLDG
jgi:sarcosine oxidase subunit alpha